MKIRKCLIVFLRPREPGFCSDSYGCFPEIVVNSFCIKWGLKHSFAKNLIRLIVRKIFWLDWSMPGRLCVHYGKAYDDHICGEKKLQPYTSGFLNIQLRAT